MTDPAPHAPSAANGATATFTKTVTESDVHLFAGITGDLAPYHVDAAFMATTSYGRRLVHGVLVLGWVSTASTKLWTTQEGVGEGVSYGYDRVRFIRPAFIGDTLTATYTVNSFDAEAGKYHATAEVTNQHGDLCLAATHITKVVRMRERT